MSQDPNSPHTINTAKVGVMKKQKSPELVAISVESLEQLKSRVDSGVFLDGDKKIVLAILGTYSWLYHQLQSSKLTLHRLKKLFGFSTENEHRHTKQCIFPAFPEKSVVN